MPTDKKYIVVLETQNSIAKSLQSKEEKLTWVMEDGKHKPNSRFSPLEKYSASAVCFELTSSQNSPSCTSPTATNEFGRRLTVLEPRWEPTFVKDPFSLAFLNEPTNNIKYL